MNPFFPDQDFLSNLPRQMLRFVSFGSNLMSEAEPLSNLWHGANFQANRSNTLPRVERSRLDGVKANQQRLQIRMPVIMTTGERTRTSTFLNVSELGIERITV